MNIEDVLNILGSELVLVLTFRVQVTVDEKHFSFAISWLGFGDQKCRGNACSIEER